MVVQGVGYSYKRGTPVTPCPAQGMVKEGLLPKLAGGATSSAFSKIAIVSQVRHSTPYNVFQAHRGFCITHF